MPFVWIPSDFSIFSMLLAKIFYYYRNMQIGTLHISDLQAPIRAR